MGELVPIRNEEAFRASTDAAGLCKEIVKQTAKPIQGRRYVSVEGWQAIAIAHGCAASADEVQRVNDEGMSGFRALGIVRRMSDGQEIARAEGFLGDDEGMWSKRPVYARRAMVQTRAISRACRSAFAHVVVMIDAGLSTTPAEEVPDEGFGDARVQDAEYVEVAPPHGDEPAAREKLEGKHKSKSALKAALKSVFEKVRVAKSLRELDAIEIEFADDLKQCERYLPLWWKGDESNGSRGWLGTIADRRHVLGIIESMTACETKLAMQNWLNSGGEQVDGLDDAARREFEAAWSAREAEIEQMDTVAA